jgi:hypothetical protein
MFDESGSGVAHHRLNWYEIDLTATGFERLTAEDPFPLLLGSIDAQVNEVAQLLRARHTSTVTTADENLL